MTAYQYTDDVVDPTVALYAENLILLYFEWMIMSVPLEVEEYLESEGIARLEWPAYAADLNTIENLSDVFAFLCVLLSHSQQLS